MAIEIRYKNDAIDEYNENHGQLSDELYKKYSNEKGKTFKINQYVSINKPDYIRWCYEDVALSSPIEYDDRSRYERVQTIRSDGKEYHATNRIRGVKYSDNDQLFVVDNSCKNRLDKVAQIVYGNSNYWWVLAHANNMFDSFNVPVGTKLRVPPIDNLVGWYFNS